MRKFLEKYWKEKEDEFFENVRESIQERVKEGSPVTWEEYSAMTMNSYERLLLYPLLTDSALYELICYCYSQSEFQVYSSYKLPHSYNDAVTGVLLPLLMKRFKNTME